jgi:hypothetical protein
MVKFNYDACKQMDTILNTESKLKKAMVMVNNNLIDSNMFIRWGITSMKIFPPVFCILTCPVRICNFWILVVGSIFFFLCEYGSYLAKAVKIVTAIFHEKITALALETTWLNTVIIFFHLIKFSRFFKTICSPSAGRCQF